MVVLSAHRADIVGRRGSQILEVLLGGGGGVLPVARRDLVCLMSKCISFNSLILVPVLNLLNSLMEFQCFNVNKAAVVGLFGFGGEGLRLCLGGGGGYVWCCELKLNAHGARTFSI